MSKQEVVLQSPDRKGTGMELIIVAGQSNAVGFDANPGELPADEVDVNIRFWWRCGDPPPDEHDSTCNGKWTYLQAQPRGNPLPYENNRQWGNFGQAEGGFGPEISLGRTLFKREGKPLAIVKAAWSGTGMKCDWNTTGEGGECYRGLIAEVKSAMSAAKAEGFALQPSAFVWVQGESDANPGDAANYTEALSMMLNSLRKELDTRQLPAFIGINTRFGANPGEPDNPMVLKIIEAQKELAAKDPFCVYVNTSGAGLANNAHFDAAGTLEIGRRYAEAMLKYRKESAS
ncbi:MAG: sialate O-acetylesterase [Lentisphaerota bacterium]